MSFSDQLFFAFSCVDPFGVLSAEPQMLTDICRQVIRRQLGEERLDKVTDLHLPIALKNFLLYQ